jgi:hypothetical protein
MIKETRFSKSGPGYLIMSIILLIGILMIAFGFFRQERTTLIIGLIITVAGVLNGILMIVIRGK